LQRLAALVPPPRVQLKRVFGIDIEACARCDEALAILASIEEPQVIAKILAQPEKTAPDQHPAEPPLGARAPPTQARLIGCAPESR